MDYQKEEGLLKSKPIDLEKETRDIVVTLEPCWGAGRFHAQFMDIDSPSNCSSPYYGETISEAIGVLIRAFNYKLTLNIQIHGRINGKFCTLKDLEEHCR